MHSRRRIAIICTFTFFLGAVPRILAEGSNPAGTVGYTGANVGEIIERVEKRIDQFAKAFKNTLDDSVDPDKQLLESAEVLEKAFDKVNGKFESGDAIRPRLDQALTAAAEINREIRNQKPTAEVASDWQAVRTGLNKLADIYGMTPLRDR